MTPPRTKCLKFIAWKIDFASQLRFKSHQRGANASWWMRLELASNRRIRFGCFTAEEPRNQRGSLRSFFLSLRWQGNRCGRALVWCCCVVPKKAGRVCPFPTLQQETQYFLWNSNPEKCLRQPRTTLNYFPSSRQLFFYSQGPEGSWKFLVINSTSCCVRLGTMKFPETDCSIAL